MVPAGEAAHRDREGEWVNVGRLAWIVGLGVTLSALLAACGSGATGASSPAAAATEVRITARDDVFDPKDIRVPAGQPVTVTFVNAGRQLHQVEIKGLIKETKLQPGQSKSFTITPKQQVYKLYCEIHQDQGMVGEFIGQ